MENVLQQIRTLVDTGELAENIDYRVRGGIIQFDAEALLTKLGGDSDGNICRIKTELAFKGFGLAMFFLPEEIGVGFRERRTIDFNSAFLTDTRRIDGCGMYCDKEGRGRYSIMELSFEECKIIRNALTAYRTGLVYGESDQRSEFREQYDRAGTILRAIERIL